MFQFERSDLDGALEALDADTLRDAVRWILQDLDDRTLSRVVTSLIERAARGGTGWAPAVPGKEVVDEVVAFAEAARRVGYADPSEVDERLSFGSAAFLGRDYAAAHRVFAALLPAIAEWEIDLGQREMVDEVLGVDVDVCAAQYVVSTYMITPPAQRAQAVRRAIAEMKAVSDFMEPIRDMERVAVEPLPQLDEFLPGWREVAEEEAAGERSSDWDSHADRWLREVIHRMEGSEALAKIARSTRRSGDLRAWCQSLAEAGEWKAALAAFEEAAELVADKAYVRGDLLDGAALSAQQLGKKNLSPWFERAWRAEPTMLRLRRWLGAARGKAGLRRRAVEALASCPKQAYRERAFLHLLQREFEAVAELLATAPGLGWSHPEHPGHLMFSMLEGLLRGESGPSRPYSEWDPRKGLGIVAFDLLASEDEAPRLAAPEAGDLLRQAGMVAIPQGEARATLLAGMRKAAENRVGGVTDKKRRRFYGHAAELVAVCLACDPSPEARRWASSLRTQYRRFPALRFELEQRLGPS